MKTAMQNQLDDIIWNLRECFDGQPWYGISMMKKLDSLDWHRANDRHQGFKSIAVLLQHIVNWRIFVLKKLQGDADFDIQIDGPNDWSEVHIDNEREWEELKETLRRTQKDLLDILTDAPEGLLKEKVPGKDYEFAPVLNSLYQHDIYHLGQIAMLHAMKGS